MAMLKNDKNNNNPKLAVAWLGPSGVGKTALITVMYKYFAETASATKIKLVTDDESQAILEEHYEKLSELCGKDFDSTGKGLAGTESPRNFKFFLERENWIGKRKSLELEFIDVPGRFMNPETASNEEYQYYVNVVRNSGAVVITIDTLALMFGSGRFHEEVNQVESITNLIKTAFENLSEPRLVIFAPIKCETFLQPTKDPKQLEVEIRKGYDELIRKVLLPKVRNVAVVITPVETVGCVVCTSWQPMKNGHFTGWYLNKVHDDASMQTRYADQPLRYLLLFLMKQYMNEQKNKVLFPVQEFLHTNDDIKEALRKLALGCCRVKPFEILQGHDLLKL